MDTAGQCEWAAQGTRWWMHKAPLWPIKRLCAPSDPYMVGKRRCFGKQTCLTRKPRLSVTHCLCVIGGGFKCHKNNLGSVLHQCCCSSLVNRPVCLWTLALSGGLYTLSPRPTEEQLLLLLWRGLNRQENVKALTACIINVSSTKTSVIRTPIKPEQGFGSKHSDRQWVVLNDASLITVWSNY